MTDPARSTWAMTQPPKMSPLPLVSAGRGITLSTSSLSVGKGCGALEFADMGTISCFWIVVHAPSRRNLLPRHPPARFAAGPAPHERRLGDAAAPVPVPVG